MVDDFSGGNLAANISEHEVTRVLAGNIESARQRLRVALEQLGYRVISEHPLRARHAARGGAPYYLSCNALEYPTHLTVELQSHGPGATQAIFAYQVKHGAFTSGDRQTLTREAEAIAALASQRATVASCAGCGAEVVADSRFCRKCGAPVKMTGVAEVELLRLTAGTRAGLQWATLGVIFLLIATIFPVLGLFIPLSKAATLFTLLWTLFTGLGGWVLGAGLRRTHLTLNPKSEKEELRLPTYSPVALPTPITNELPVSAPYHSITESTTDLLPALPASEARPLSHPPESSAQKN